MRAAQAYAALAGREYVLPDDVKFLVTPVLAHRLVLRNEEKIRGITAREILEDLVHGVAVPGAEG